MDQGRFAALAALDAEASQAVRVQPRSDAEARAEVDAQLLDEITIDSSKETALRVRLADKFRPTDFVRVKNIDDEYFGWLYMPASKESVTETETSRTTLRQQPDRFVLAPGEEKVIEGSNAYVMIERLVKHLVQKRGLAKVQSGEAKLNDGRNVFSAIGLPESQDALIKLIIQSIEDLESFSQRFSEMSKREAARPQELQAQAEDDLGLSEDDDEPEFPTVNND